MTKSRRSTISGFRNSIRPSCARLAGRPDVTVRQCLMEVVGRLEFHSSASLRLPPHMVDE